MDFSSYSSESIFSPQELSALEQQLAALHKCAKDTRTVAKDEFFKLVSAFEAETMTIKSSGNKDDSQKKRMADCLALLQDIVRQTDDILVDDMNFMEDQMKLLRKIKNSNDQWAQLELRTILGEELVDTEAMMKEIAERSVAVRDEFMTMMVKLRGVLDENNTPKLFAVLKRIQNGEDWADLEQQQPEPEPQSEPAQSQPQAQQQQQPQEESSTSSSASTSAEHQPQQASGSEAATTGDASSESGKPTTEEGQAEQQPTEKTDDAKPAESVPAADTQNSEAADATPATADAGAESNAPQENAPSASSSSSSSSSSSDSTTISADTTAAPAEQPKSD
jgi:hypothetical protein